MISSVAQSLAFKAVYCNKHTMTKAQNVVADKIFAKLYQYDSNKNNGGRYVDTYRSEGIDFIIKPAPDGHSVYLDAYEDKENVDEILTSENFSRVGTYNIGNPFKVKDIENSSGKFMLSDKWKLFGMMAALAAIVFMPIITHVRKSINPHYLKFEKKITADTIGTVQDTVKTDKLKFNEMLYRGIN